MTEVPPFLFIVTSTALVLGVAIAVRGLIGFRPVATMPALPSPGVATPTMPVTDTPSTDPDAAPSDAGDSVSAAAVSTGPRDLKEPMIMTIAGAIIAIIALYTLSALINSA